jgi:ribosomal protein S18 acetylase RimI-like enzyme
MRQPRRRRSGPAAATARQDGRERHAGAGHGNAHSSHANRKNARYSPDAPYHALTAFTDAELYRRGCRTLLASWDEYARGAIRAAVHRLPGVAAAVFPDRPERDVYNNAVLDRGMRPAARSEAVKAMESAYAGAGVDRFAAWAHERDEPMRALLERRGYTLQETTRAMGIDLAAVRPPRPAGELGRSEWSEYLRIAGLPPGLLAGVDPAAFHVAVARLDGESVAARIALDLDGDCGIYNVGTMEHARRRGLGTAVTAVLVHDALERGCETASLRSTATAEGVYARVGFRDLGRILEYGPPAG